MNVNSAQKHWARGELKKTKHSFVHWRVPDRKKPYSRKRALLQNALRWEKLPGARSYPKTREILFHCTPTCFVSKGLQFLRVDTYVINWPWFTQANVLCVQTMQQHSCYQGAIFFILHFSLPFKKKSEGKGHRLEKRGRLQSIWHRTLFTWVQRWRGESMFPRWWFSWSLTIRSCPSCWAKPAKLSP